jgi:hypothetical protein
MHLDGSLTAGVIRTPEVLDEFFARGLALDRREKSQDAMLGRGELDAPSCDEGTRRGEVDRQIAGGNDPVIARARHGPGHADDGRQLPVRVVDRVQPMLGDEFMPVLVP